MTDQDRLEAVLRGQHDLAARMARVEEAQKATASALADLLQRLLHKLDGSLPRSTR